MSIVSGSKLEIGGCQFSIARPHAFGLVLTGVVGADLDDPSDRDYLHQILLAPKNRIEFLNVVESEGLVVCKNVHSTDPTYRRVRGKSSSGKLSQAEYYHHDGCSCPTKPRVVEIRMPHQDIERHVATAIAPFPDVIRAQLKALPTRLQSDRHVAECREKFVSGADELPAVETWDQIQGRITRLVRKEMDAETCRAYFREVDMHANAYVLPWEMGESRIMINNGERLEKTMQHRRSYQKPRAAEEQNGSLVKRWTAEEYGAA
ncbi:MAG: hypothetical protein AB8B55_05260 [Mariniblastus sp.]